MKVLIEIDEEEYKTLSSLSDREKVNDLMGYEKIIANGTPLNGTNGDVLKAVFPNAIRSGYIENDMTIIYLQDENESEMVVPEDWWNAEYKGVE